MTAAFNHLWQSSLFALLAAALNFALRNHSPKLRYIVWLSASLKFLIPFALLVSLGTVFPRPAQRSLAIAPPSSPNVLIQLAQPIPPILNATAPARAPTHWDHAIAALWALGFALIARARCRGWLRIRAALRAGTPIELPIPFPALITPHTDEPGVVGILRPVLVLPAQLIHRLTRPQFDAVLTHELCHAQRRDNLFAAMHMAVEAIFWFHPLVWYIGSRLIEERELACDEEVLRRGFQPADYAQAILNVCRFRNESPLPCVSGATGADVKKRLRAIVAGTIAADLNIAGRLALAAIALTAIVAPVLIGVLNPPAIRAQNAPAATPKFEVASIKPCQFRQEPGGMYPPRGNSSPGRLGTGCYPLLDSNGMGLIRRAWVDSPFTPINGGPSWIRSAFYEINATAEGSPAVATMRGPMMRVLLEERFQLKIHSEFKEGPVYFLTVARGGPKLRRFIEGTCAPWSTPPPPLSPGQQYCSSNISSLSPPSLELHGATLADFSKLLLAVLDRPVIDKIGIAGRFDFRVEFAREGTRLAATLAMQQGDEAIGPPSIFTALQEQLGLKLEPAKGPIETFVIDRIAKPASN